MLPSSGVLGDAVGGRLATEGRTVGFLLGAFEGIRVGTGVLVGAKETDGAAVGEFVLVGEAVDGAPTRSIREDEDAQSKQILPVLLGAEEMVGDAEGFIVGEAEGCDEPGHDDKR